MNNPTNLKKKAKKPLDCISCEEVAQLKDTLKNVNQKLIEAEQMKSNFISNISNELLNPFTSIIALARNILEVKKENWKKVISMVSLIHSEAFNLDFQFKNIIAAAKVEAGETYPEISDVEILGLVTDIADSFKYEAKKKNIQIKYYFTGEIMHDNFYFRTDAEKIRLIISNLLSNAIKFSYNNGMVIIEVCVKNNLLIITVQDFGTGISEQNQKIIFDRFNRADSGISSAVRGHGLGLSINKAFIDMLHGTIALKTAAKKGTTFTVTLPYSEDTSAGITLDGNELLFK
jgi:signal transduction histidine kinase